MTYTIRFFARDPRRHRQPLARLLLVLAGLGLAATGQAQTDHYSALIQASQPQFAARLETPSKPDASALLGRTPASAMEYRIVSDRINNRRFFKLLADAIAVNSDASLLAKNATYISRSRSALPTELQPNDSLVFRFDGESTVRLSLNGTELATYPAPDFYRMLVATWVGNVPISSRFKREILGQETTPDDVRALFDSTQVSAARRQQVAQLVQASAAPVATAVVAAAPKPVAPKPVPKPEPAPKAEPKVVQPAPPKPAAKPTPEPVVAKAVVKPAPETVTKASPKPAEPAQPAASAVPAKPAPAAEMPALAKQEAPPELSEEEEAVRLLVRQEYLKRLNSEINIHKHIPQRAFTRRAEGSVRLAIALDKAGRLLKVEIVEPSKHNMFNEQALEAVGDAQPFTPPPNALEADPFEFETTLYYDLPL